MASKEGRTEGNRTSTLFKGNREDNQFTERPALSSLLNTNMRKFNIKRIISYIRDAVGDIKKLYYNAFKHPDIDLPTDDIVLTSDLVPAQDIYSLPNSLFNIRAEVYNHKKKEYRVQDYQILIKLIGKRLKTDKTLKIHTSVEKQST